MSGCALTMAPFDAGLTNQKYALLGLALRARAAGRAVAMPVLVDFVPGAAGATVPLGEVLDVDALVAGLAAFGVIVADGASVEVLDPAPLFDDAGRTIVESRRAGDAKASTALCGLLAAMRLAPALAAALPRIEATGVQLRIECDWQAYAAGPLAAAFPNETLYLGHAAILERITATFGRGLRLYATCNRADLPVAQERIVADAREAGHALLFRGDVGAPRGAGPLADAAIDFALMLRLTRIVGHSRSTFFNALALTRHGEGRYGEAWLYNVGGARLKRRTDDGAYPRPWAATAAPA